MNASILCCHLFQQWNNIWFLIISVDILQRKPEPLKSIFGSEIAFASDRFYRCIYLSVPTVFAHFKLQIQQTRYFHGVLQIHTTFVEPLIYYFHFGDIASTVCSITLKYLHSDNDHRCNICSTLLLIQFNQYVSTTFGFYLTLSHEKAKSFRRCYHWKWTCFRKTQVVEKCVLSVPKHTCSNSGLHVAWTTQFCTVAPKYLWVLSMELFHVTLLAPAIWRFLLDFWKFSEHLPCNIEGYLYIYTNLFVPFDAFRMYVVMRGTKLFQIITYSVPFVEEIKYKFL
jgi:hypothetical protein